MKLGIRWKIIGAIAAVEVLLFAAIAGFTFHWFTASTQQTISAEQSWQLIGALALLVLLAIGSTAFVVHTLSTRFARQLIRLTETAREIRHKGPGAQVEIAEDDELGRLASAFNKMSLSLQATQQELQASIEEQQKLSELLDTHRSILTATISSANDAVIVIDHNGDVVEYNKSAERIFGFSRYEVLGNELAELIIPEKFRNAHRAGMRRFRESGEAKVLGQRLELVALHKDGHEFPCELAIHGVKVGKETHFTAFMRDISDRINLEQELRLAGYAFDANEAIFITDADANIVRVNQAFTRITGYQEDEVIGQNPRILSSHQHTDEFYQDMWHTLTTTGKWSGEIMNRHKNGDLLPELLSISSVTQEDGSISNFVAHFADLREQKAVEQSLRQARTEAELASQAKSRFLATMSHEIRTPLNAIINMNRLLLETALTEQQRHLVTSADDAGNVLLAIVNNVLDFSRIEAGQFALNPDWFNPLHVTQSLVELFQASAAQKCIGLSMGHQLDNPVEVYGDALRYRQVLLNLIGNAVKFTQKGDVRIELLIDASGLKVSVSDTGPGIESAKQPYLFDEFYQLKDINSMERSGTGLGLAITKQLIDMMQGKIELTSTLGEGSTFTIWLPLESRAAESEPSDNRLPTGNKTSSRNIRILLVEDSASNRAVAHQVLANLASEVVEAENGKIAVELAAKQRFDLILMDVAMPVLNGLRATEMLREGEGPNRDTPIVAMTANAFKEDKQACLDAGMDDFLSKPVDISAMRAKVALWSAQRSERWLEEQVAADRKGEDAHPAVEAEPASEQEQAKYEAIELLNEDVLHTLIRETSRATVKSILDTLKEEAQARVFAVKVLAGNANWQQVEIEAHTLQSSMGTFGASRFQQLAKDIEHAAKAQDQQAVNNLEHRLQLMLDVTMAALDSFLAEDVVDQQEP
ncbi:PAS domain S-box protein [Neiella sp. HB171785]|uniref:Sensory/regulatory protein RpfC n=1 Tax=Neiella litorisoli TaxID=2771431 RepID=A0A8J6UJK5_9GAMM|nr:PAS domain S-box protein [Neiella litorisoli]MBD1390768.1 PAS domain S-box protein [Neiella litorisoli]